MTEQTKQSTIMLVDDEPELLKMLTIFLESSGFCVRGYTCPVEAFEYLCKDHENVDLVVTDIRMPQMDGIHLLSSIRQLSTTIPVILMTGYTDFKRVAEGVRNNAFDLILKPIELEQFNWCITRALGHLKYTKMEDQYKKRLEERVINLNQLLQEQFEEVQRLRALLESASPAQESSL